MTTKNIQQNPSKRDVVSVINIKGFIGVSDGFQNQTLMTLCKKMQREGTLQRVFSQTRGNAFILNGHDVPPGFRLHSSNKRILETV